MRQFRLFGLVWLAAILLSLPACAEDGLSVSTKGGYARLIFAPNPAGEVKAQLTGSVLAIGLPHATTISPETLRKALPDYIQSARIDADRRTLRFALSQSVRLHVSASGGRTAVDLLPASYAGTPPPLPPPPGKQTAAPLDMSKVGALKVRVGAYRNFTRIVFDWPGHVSYQVVPATGRLTLRFNTPAKPDFTAMNRVAAPWIRVKDWHIEGHDTVIVFDIDSDSGFHDFRDGNNVVLDILAPRTDADAYQPPGDAKVTVTHFSGAAKTDTAKKEASPVSDKQRQEIEAAAAKLNGETLKPPKGEKNAPAAKPAADGDKTLAVAVATDHNGIVLTVPDGAGLKAAVFMRGNDAWIVVLSDKVFDNAAIRSKLGAAVKTVDAVASNGISVLRLSLPAPAGIAAYAEGPNMKVLLAAHAVGQGNVREIAFSRQQDDYTHMVLEAMLNGAVRPVTLNDPAVRDRIIAIPGTLGQLVSGERTFVEFSALKTAAGIALIPYIDNLDVKVDAPRIVLSRRGGLALTQNAMPTLDLPAGDTVGDAAFLDFAAWGRWRDSSFLSTERSLRAAAAAAPRSKVFDARMELARFYLANKFSAEALGLVKIMSADKPTHEQAVQLLVMRAAAEYRMGRYRESCNGLTGAGLDNNRHVMLWRGLNHAAMGDYAGAASDLDIAMPVVKRYVPEVQAEVRIAAAKAALALGKNDYAKAQIDRLPPKLPAAVNAEADLVRARLATIWGERNRAAELFASAEKEGNERTKAEVSYWRIDAGLQAGALKPEQAINALERLRYRWRGDHLELMTLEKLAELYFKLQRWRDGLTTLRIATKYFPGSNEGGKAQDEMRNIFSALFLNGKADKMKPSEALGLFYDFVELTPIGPDGDKMIRKMADRLASVDLLGPASDLLQYQVTKRLDTGMARAQVATRLAMFQLMDHKPKEALETLTSTNISTLPDTDRYQRLLMQTRALMELKRWDEALDLIDVVDTPETVNLRAEIYWRSGNWDVAGQKTEQLLGDCWHDATPLSDEQRQLTMRAAVAYALAGDEDSLERVRARFAAKMQKSPDADAFAVVTQRTDMQGMAFRDAAAKVAAVDTLQSFMKRLAKQK